MASYDKSYSTDYTTRVQNILQGLGADLGRGGVDGKWGAYTDAAYNQYKSQVDAALAGNPYAGAGGAAMVGGYTAFTAPQISYKTRTLDEIMAEANGLVGGAYDAQMLRQTQGYESAKKSLAENYNNARKTTQDSAVARGLGRSSYLTDAVANMGVKESAAAQELAGNYNDMMAQLQANKSSAVYSYATAQQAQEQQLAMQTALQQAQLQYQYDQLRFQQEEAARQAELLEKQLKAASGSTKTSTPAPSEPEPTPEPENLYSYLAELDALSRTGSGEEYARMLYEMEQKAKAQSGKK